MIYEVIYKTFLGIEITEIFDTEFFAKEYLEELKKQYPFIEWAKLEKKIKEEI